MIPRSNQTQVDARTRTAPFISRRSRCLRYARHIMLLIFLECLMQIRVALILATSLICGCILLLDRAVVSACSSLTEPLSFFLFQEIFNLHASRVKQDHTQPGIVILIMPRTTYTRAGLIGSYSRVEQVLITSHLDYFLFFISAAALPHHRPLPVVE